ncbi:hypothetical protein WR25_23820 [Diploscapter pachys]|uniref:Uncharacterized protein n=1 Tax=Diploscapter pachys TaxID=2018661 RepID=A0A2A2J823_9BILA|nr:hypothetical protein WR25_23820 [Diploscapter pachys]
MGRLSLVLLLAACIVSSIYTHSHSHEAPHLKYTKEVNEQAAREVKEDHAHSHSHSHGHSHEGGGCPHAHSHGGDDHDHSHDHAHDHGSHSHSHSHDSHGHSHGHDDASHAHSHSNSEHREKRSTHKAPVSIDDYKFEGKLAFLNDPATRLYVFSIGSTLLISIAPFFILTFIPIQANTADSESLLKVLLSFGSGGLLGDAFLHLIPHAAPAGEDGHSHSHSHSHAAGSHGHSHGHGDMRVGGWVLGGIIAFLTVEKLVRILKGNDGGHGHSHGHSHAHAAEKKEEKKTKDTKKKAKKSDDESTGDEKEEKEEKHEHGGNEVGGIKVTAYLNLVADFTHNFTDGLAIGASFIAGTKVGIITMITILFHEIPHEIGDFAILIQSGYSKRKAMMVQLLTALGAMSGCLLSLYSADPSSLADAATSSWVLPFTAGGFIYIATVSVIPELLENSSGWQSVKEIIALLIGIAMMYLIALYE